MSWQDRLFEDKTLLQVFRKSQKLPSKRINFAVPLLTFLAVCVFSYSGHVTGFDLLGRSEVINTVRLISETGVAYTSAILGFLIAGFSIFASITKPEIFVVLAQMQYKETNVTRLEFVFYNFILVFIHYIVFLSVCLFLVFGFSDGALFATATKAVVSAGYPVVDTVGPIVLSILSAWFAYMLILLKAFIWNLYQSVLLSLAAEAELKRRDIDPITGQHKES